MVVQQLRFILFLSLLCSTVFSQAKNKGDSVYLCAPCGSSCDDTGFLAGGTCPHCHMPLQKGILTASYKFKQMTICFYLQDGVEVLDFAGPMEVFSYAGFSVFTVSSKKQLLRSQGIVNLIPDYSIEDAPPFDMLAVFGGNASKAYKDTQVIDWIRSRQQTTKYYFSVCTGAFILATAGLLDGLTATTFHLSIDDLRKQFPAVHVQSNVRFVDNGQVITTAGISAGIDGALHLVARMKGEDAAKRVAEMIEYDKWKSADGLILKSIVHVPIAVSAK